MARAARSLRFSTAKLAPTGAARRRATRTTMPARGSTPVPGSTPVADALRPLVTMFLGDDPALRFECWDGSVIGSPAAVATVRFCSPDAVRRIVWMPNELGLARAYVAGDLELEGDLFAAVAALLRAKPALNTAIARALPSVLTAAAKVGALGRPLPPPPEEARLGGGLHSLRRDRAAISHHYDVGNDFYRLVLGPSMVYSCARFAEPADTLEDAQAAKCELICRKLGLHERVAPARLLDVGCGWGTMAIHAATHHGARVVGVTISTAQAELARRRAEEAGVADRVEIRLQDYRDLAGETFDAISSIGMSEHVGHDQIDRYFATLRGVLAPGGRLLNHAITSAGGSRLGRRSFVGRYVFPDGELIDVGTLVLAMERAGFEVRDVEALREHYARTLRAWVANLEASWDRAVELVGPARAKVWRLYMAGSAVNFERNGISIHQVLGVATDGDGASGMPPTRRSWG